MTTKLQKWAQKRNWQKARLLSIKSVLTNITLTPLERAKLKIALAQVYLC